MAGEKSSKDPSIVARFHKIVLSWDYLRLCTESNKNSKDIGDGAALGLKKVKETYKDVDDYISTFEPLLFEEVKAQIAQGRDQDDVTEWKLAVVASCTESDGFHIPVVGYDSGSGESIVENDLLLVSPEKFQENAAPPKVYAFALVLNREGSNHVKLRTYLAGEVQLTDIDKITPCTRLQKMRSKFKESEKSTTTAVYILKIASLSTIVREYVGLWSIKSLPFKDLILSAAEKDSKSEGQSWKIPKPLMEFLESNHNKSQLDAIRAGLSRKTFVLIQGPPGTGKTQTILGLLSAILHSTPARVQSKNLRDKKRGAELGIHEKYDHWKQASPWMYDTNPRDKIMPIDGDDGFFPTTGNELKPEVVNSNRKYRVRVLVCAPSNSALDEIVLRVLSTGIRDEADHAYNPKIVRIGVKPHHSVHAVSMDHLVEQKLSEMNSTSADARKRGATGDRDSIRASVLEEAAIVFSTLSFSGSTLFSKMNHTFDVVIIDEAAQAVEPATLVPLAYGCKQVFLVGDPEQLPATVISPTAERFGYGMSLFKRFEMANYKVEMLNTQYRMHPKINQFPSNEFYGGNLHNGPDVEEQTERAWHVYRCFGPFVFFDIAEGVESQPSGSGSWVNVDEVEFILLMYHKLATNYPELKSSSRLAIITPYRHQMKLLRDLFRDKFGVEADKLVDINTVDGFQGREKDVAIFSCVRASDSKGIGFLADKRRMNVGITRARSSILVVGSASTLQRDKRWKKLIDSAESEQRLFKVSKPYAPFFSDKNLETMQVEANTEEAEFDMDDLMNDALMYGNAGGEVDQGQADEEDYGDGDGGGDD